MTTASSPSPVAAMWFLYSRSIRNRLASQLRRARSPRYLAAVVLGAFYLWWALFRNTRVNGNPLSSLIALDFVIPVVSALMLISAARWWLFGAERGTLAFAPAEVQFLFPAPVSRRALIHAKLVRTQLAILLNTLIFTVLLRGGSGSAAEWRRGLALWIGFSVFALHRLGASIVRANAIEHERPGQRRSVLPILVFTALLGAVVWGLVAAAADLRVAAKEGLPAVGRVLVDALQQPIPSFALWPVRALVEPVFASDAATWLRTAPLAFGMLLVHYLWVIRLDASFEEAALEATRHRAERLQRFRTSQMGKTRSRKGKLAWVPKLPSFGPPALAVAWKNVAAALRGGTWRGQLIAFSLGLVFMSVLIRSAAHEATDLFVGMAAGWGAMLIFIGPLTMRFDLRLDLPRLAMLKAWPLPGRQIVAAEIAAVTILHSITIWAVMAVPLVVARFDPTALESIGVGLPIMVSVIIGVPILNSLIFTIQNATALMFPAWVRMGTEARGFETMGQNLLTMGATTLVAAVALVFPVGLGLLITFFGDALGAWRWPLATSLGGVLLLLELWPIIHWLGDLFERTDVTEIAAAA